jgi:hypothetical protein
MLFLWFQVELEQRDYGHTRHGPIFTRWLPAGREDALHFNTGHSKAKMLMWFERQGRTNGEGFTEFEKGERSVNPQAIKNQGGLEAGNLLGLLTLEEISETEIGCLNERRHGDATYLDLGKRVVNLIYPSVSRMLDLLRVVYGQFWLPQFPRYDSREWSLGSYCSDVLGLEWSLNEKGGRVSFLPDLTSRFSDVVVVSSSTKAFLTYLTRSDWMELQRLINMSDEVPLAGRILSNARSLKAQGEIRLAIVEATTALELAIKSKLRQMLRNSQKCSEKAQAFYQLALAQQVAILGSTLKGVSVARLEQCLLGIQSRNSVVHDGAHPEEIPESQWDGLFNVTISLLEPPTYKLPLHDIGSMIALDDVWSNPDS